MSVDLSVLRGFHPIHSLRQITNHGEHLVQWRCKQYRLFLNCWSLVVSWPSTTKAGLSCWDEPPTASFGLIICWKYSNCSCCKGRSVSKIYSAFTLFVKTKTCMCSGITNMTMSRFTWRPSGLTWWPSLLVPSVTLSGEVGLYLQWVLQSKLNPLTICQETVSSNIFTIAQHWHEKMLQC